MKERMSDCWAVPRNRITVTAFIVMGLCAAVLVVFDEDSAVEEMPAPKAETQERPSMKGRFMQENIAVFPSRQERDPFRPANGPSQKKSVAPAQDSAPVPILSTATNSLKTASFAVRSVRPRLAGIITEGDRAIALLEYQAESSACGEGEMVGPYRVTRILTRAVVLEGRGESFSLRIER